MRFLVLVSLFAFVLPSLQDVPPTAEMQAMLDKINTERRVWGSPDLIWSNALATVATWAASRCAYAFSLEPERSTRYISALGVTGSATDPLYKVGEMLEAGYSTRPSGASFTNRKEWDCLTDSCSLGSTECKLYRLTIWEKTTKVGCAIAACTTNSPFVGATSPNWNVLYCEFNTEGGAAGQRSVSTCPTPRTPSPTPPRTPVPTPTVRTPVPTPTVRTPVPTPTVRTPVPTPTVRTPVPTPTVRTPVPTPTVRTPVPTPTVRTPVPTPTVRTPVPTPTVRTPVPTPTAPVPTPSVRTPTPTNANSVPTQFTTVFNQHNTERNSLRLPLLSWDSKLAQVAAEYAAQCVWAHSNSTKRNERYGTLNGVRFDQYNINTYVGENLAMTTGTSVDALGWINEKKDWACAANTCPSGAQCGHYTQIVWQATSKVGCAYQNCGATGSAWLYLVCNYAQAGNFIGQHPFSSPSVTCPKISLTRSLHNEEGVF